MRRAFPVKPHDIEFTGEAIANGLSDEAAAACDQDSFFCWIRNISLPLSLNLLSITL